MGYRIMQLQKEIMGRKIEVVQGVTLDITPKSFGFVRFDAIGPRDKKKAITLIQEYGVYSVKGGKHGFKDIYLCLPEKDETVEEDAIILLIEYIPQIKTSGTRIAGRCPEEGVFLLKPGDTIELERNLETEKYAALKYEGHMYLIKLYNE